jgi:hypothetical protein
LNLKKENVRNVIECILFVAQCVQITNIKYEMNAFESKGLYHGDDLFTESLAYSSLLTSLDSILPVASTCE